MALPNTNAPYGLMPIASLTGMDDIPTNRYFIPQADTNAYFIGSPMKLTSAADANGVPGCIAAVGTDTLLGSLVGAEPANVNAPSMVGVTLTLEQASIPATKIRDYYVLVADDPLTIFTMQADATATNQTAANANKNASMTITNPSPATLPQSASVISSATIATTNTLNLRLMGLYQQPGQAFGAFSVYRCKINQHVYANGATGV